VFKREVGLSSARFGASVVCGSLQIWIVVVHILNNQTRTTKWGGPPAWEEWGVWLVIVNNQHFYNDSTAPTEPGPPHYQGFTVTLGMSPLDEWSARRRDFYLIYLTSHNTHNSQTSMPTTGFEPVIPASERPQTHALDRASSWIGNNQHITTCYVRRGCVNGIINLWVP